jgi:hypothetical protein
MSAYYFGMLKNTTVVEIFNSRTMPTYNSHGDLYGFIFGGYKNKTDAFRRANWQFSYASQYRFFDGRKKECKTNHDLYKIAGIA